MPDINNIEALADVLDVSLLDLMQARRTERDDTISTQKAEELLMDTIQLSKGSNKYVKIIGGTFLTIFVVIAVLLLCLLVSDGTIVLFSVLSIITGLIAWGIPIWQLAIARTPRIVGAAIASLGFALLSLTIQFLDIASEIRSGDFAAVDDTINALILVVLVFISITFVLNLLMSKFAGCTKRKALLRPEGPNRI